MGGKITAPGLRRLSGGRRRSETHIGAATVADIYVLSERLRTDHQQQRGPGRSGSATPSDWVLLSPTSF